MIYIINFIPHRKREAPETVSGIFISLAVKDLLWVLWMASNILASGVFWPLFLGMYYRWATTTGAMIWRGNMAVTEGGGSINYYWEIYSIMGDPSLEAYLGVPQVNLATYPEVLFLGLETMQVTAEPYSYVALSMNGELYTAALVDENGTATLDFDAFTNPGMASIVITKQNCIQS